MSRAVREECGCTHDHRRWIKLCPPHEAEHAELHARAAADHAASKVPEVPT